MNSAFAVPPPFAADWFDLNAEETELAWRVLLSTSDNEDLSARIRSGPHRARAASLEFYGPGWSMIDFEVDILRGPACFSVIAGPRRMRLARGASSTVYASNLDASFKPVGDPDLIAGYLRYFVGLLWAQDGAFALIESAENLREHFPPGPADQALPFSAPLTVTPARKHTAVQALMAHGGTISLTELSVNPSGGVDMTSEKEIVTGLTDALIGYETPFRFPMWHEGSRQS